ncbi:hypothetical protein [Ralstonia mannitolilytica]|uniref:hypothetical protein n=1 Tax=Ralstonia mannitolilytica TaxID=105219 RepID=UPI001C94F549|nr:hypothetical protein [Ralstonia mannitolilytica]MBY4720022.1 hypothetical protein [Ralstonia mannitolilytica]
MPNPFKPIEGRTQNIAATSSAGSFRLSPADMNASSTVRILNTGANPVFVRASNSAAPGGAVAATTTVDLPVAAGATVILSRDPFIDTYSFVYAAAQSGTVYLTPGTGGN